MYTLLLVIFVIVSLLLIIIVLMQRGRGSDVGAAFGFTKITYWLGAIFLGLAILLTLIHPSRKGSILENENLPPVEQRKINNTGQGEGSGTPSGPPVENESPKLKTEEGVFIPRPETELLVEKILEILPEDFEGRGLDIGGGTGCISIALLKERKGLVMYSTDINKKAVELMIINSKINGVSDRFFPARGDLLGPFSNMKLGTDSLPLR